MFSAARWRLTGVFTAILIVILATSGAIVYFTTRSLIFDRVDAELKDKAQQDLFLAEDDRHGGDDGPGGGGDGDKEFDPGGYSFAILAEGGEVIETSYGYDASMTAPQWAIDEALDDGHAIAETETSDGETVRLCLLGATEPDGDSVVLQVGRSIERELDTLSELRVILAAVVVVSIVPALGGGYVLSGRVLRPIKAAVDAQRAFVADASHELRTPVAVVRTNAEILERHIEAGRIGEVDSQAVRDILSETERLGRLVGQMLTLAEVDAGQQIVRRSPLELGELAEDVYRSLKTLSATKGVGFELNLVGEAWVSGDRDRLREVLVTVIDNAIKYTPAGGHVDVTVESAHRRARVTVADTGAGIPKALLGHVFTRFYRVDRARSRDEGGTGLGLAIAREVVQAHGGDMRIESDSGRGTRVTIELGLIASGEVPERPPARDAEAQSGSDYAS